MSHKLVETIHAAVRICNWCGAMEDDEDAMAETCPVGTVLS